jgi:plasmid stability protein
MKFILLRNVPSVLHQKVKVAAAAAGVSMQDYILDLMLDSVAGSRTPRNRKVRTSKKRAQSGRGK